MRGLKISLVLFTLCLAIIPAGCNHGPEPEEIIVYCGVDEPYASKVFAEFEKQSGIHVAIQYDIESSKSVGLAGKLEAESAHPRADVWWGSEAFLSTRLASENILEPYAPTTGTDIPPEFKDPQGYWTGIGLRARVLAISNPPPLFQITGIEDLADPRLKNKICISRPTAGATGAHVAALYVFWGRDKTIAFFHKLHDNGIAALGGNAEVADQVGNGVYSVGLTDSDDVSNSSANGGKLSMVVPDQSTFGTLAMPTTIGLVRGTRHEQAAKKLIDFLASKQVEQMLIDMKYARWSVRGGAGQEIKAMKIDYREAAKVYAQAQRETTAILDGRM